MKTSAKVWRVSQRLLTSIILWLVAIVISGDLYQLLACTCAPTQICDRINEAKVAFLGEGLEQITLPGMPGRYYRFRVDRIYKGLSGQTKEIIVDPDNMTSCGTEYRMGVKYVIFSYASPLNKNIVRSGGCSGSFKAEPNSEAIAYIERYVRGELKSEVWGKVFQMGSKGFFGDEKEVDGLEDAEVTLKSNAKTFTTKSRKDGSYSFSEVPEGTYELTANLKSYTLPLGPQQIIVSKQGCKEYDIALNAQSGIQGKLLLPNLKPAIQKRMEIFRRDSKGEYHYIAWQSTTDNGEFAFKNIPSGLYLLKHESGYYEEYPTYYYPGVTEKSYALPISIEPNQTINNITLELPAPHVRRKIIVKVTWEDGKPVGDNLLQISSDEGHLKNLEGKRKDNLAVFDCFQEREYKFDARYWVDDLRSNVPYGEKRIAEAPPIKVAKGKEDVEITLLLSRTLKKDDH